MALPIDLESTWLNPASVQLDADELRRADSTIFTHSGVVRTNDTTLAVSVSGADIVTVQPGPVVVPCNATGGAGYYRFALAAVQTGALAARNATNPRIDLVIARQMDTDIVPAHGAYTGRIEILAGTPSATPSAPALPDLAVELGRITVPPTGGGAATMDATFRTYAAGAGGTLYVPTAARLPATAAKWRQAIALDTGYAWVYNGTAWVTGDATQNPIPHTVRYRSATVGFVNNSYAVVSFDAVDQADAANFSYSAGTITCTRGGVYVISAGIGWAGSGTGRRGSRIVVDGVSIREQVINAPGTNSMNTQIGVTRRINPGATIRIDAFQDSGGTLNMAGGLLSTSLSLSRMGA